MYLTLATSKLSPPMMSAIGDLLAFRELRCGGGKLWRSRREADDFNSSTIRMMHNLAITITRPTPRRNIR
jgi:hypothetical protein